MSASFVSYTDRLLFGLALAWLVPAPASACDAMLVASAPTLQFDYDPFAFTKTTARGTFEIESRAATACDMDFVLLDAGHVAIAERDIDNTGVTVTLTVATTDGVATALSMPGYWRIRVEPGHRTKVYVDGLVAQDAVATAGLHNADLFAELRDVGAPTSQSAAAPVHLVLNAKPRAQMNIAGAAGTFGTGANVSRIDFGTITDDVSRRVFLQIRANTAARLTIASANSGRLLRNDDPKSDAGIVYNALLEGQTIDLTQQSETVVDPPHSLDGKSYALDLRIGTAGAHVAGAYSDVLTLELSAL